MAVSKSQVSASRKWEQQNPHRTAYTKLRRTAFSFVNPKPGSKAEEHINANHADYVADLEELKQAIIEKEKTMKTKIENQLYDALKKWVETADSTPSEPDHGVVLTYQANDGTLSFWKDFYEDDFEDLSFEDLVEAEEALGYDKIAGVLLDQVKSSPNYNEENAKNFIEYLGK
ncbi:hypothetical protein CYJ85_00520 [Limosilactobacillus fermentum]|uniref:hypothetical protein n=1 Tax=Limosilactobacillus fermentum TaxID=1613 RepID=UPI000C7CAA4F|nr:hypothetical protein [Limosilactobacillus fermentum]PLT15961.1 hypothetical protein CYJ85_00520 [Limosilactobacillus fermentum]